MATSNERDQNPAPLDYITPAFPSLYWPFPPQYGTAFYLYYTSDVWRFTFLWTLIIYGVIHLVASAYAVSMQLKNWKLVWIVPAVYAVVGGIEAIMAGSVVGLM